MISTFFLSKMVKQKLLENKRNMLKVRSIERKALATANTSTFLIEYHCKYFYNEETVKGSNRPSI